MCPPPSGHPSDWLYALHLLPPHWLRIAVLGERRRRLLQLVAADRVVLVVLVGADRLGLGVAAGIAGSAAVDFVDTADFADVVVAVVEEGLVGLISFSFIIYIIL